MEPAQTDGRMQRSARTRTTVVEAHVALLREGVLRPTSAQIAERAGVSRRTLWSNFHDMETLLQNTVDYWFASDDALRDEIDVKLPLDQRISRFCAERARRLQNIAPAARAAILAEPYSEALRSSRAGHIDRVRGDLARVFAAEIAAANDRQTLVDCLITATSWNAWSLLADDHGYGAERCQAAMERAVRALLAPGRPVESPR